MLRVWGRPMQRVVRAAGEDHVLQGVKLGRRLLLIIWLDQYFSAHPIFLSLLFLYFLLILILSDSTIDNSNI